METGNNVNNETVNNVSKVTVSKEPVNNGRTTIVDLNPYHALPSTSRTQFFAEEEQIQFVSGSEDYDADDEEDIRPPPAPPSTPEPIQFEVRRVRRRPRVVLCGSIPVLNFGRIPQKVLCPYCNVRAKTCVKYDFPYKRKYKLTVMLMFLLPCIMMPRCHMCKVPHHYCSKCEVLLGVHTELT